MKGSFFLVAGLLLTTVSMNAMAEYYIVSPYPEGMVYTRTTYACGSCHRYYSPRSRYVVVPRCVRCSHQAQYMRVHQTCVASIYSCAPRRYAVITSDEEVADYAWIPEPEDMDDP